MSSASFLPSRLSLLAVFLSLLSLLTPSQCLVQKGVVNSNDADGLAFVARFCFDYDPSDDPVGNLRIDLHDPKWYSHTTYTDT